MKTDDNFKSSLCDDNARVWQFSISLYIMDEKGEFKEETYLIVPKYLLN